MILTCSESTSKGNRIREIHRNREISAIVISCLSNLLLSTFISETFKKQLTQRRRAPFSQDLLLSNTDLHCGPWCWNSLLIQSNSKDWNHFFISINIFIKFYINSNIFQVFSPYISNVDFLYSVVGSFSIKDFSKQIGNQLNFFV